MRLAFAMQRFELRLLLGVAAIVIVAALGIAWQTRVVRDEQLDCYRQTPSAEEGDAFSPCHAQDPTLQTLETAAGFAKVGVIGVPILMGAFLGVPIVARELEGRTAHLSWSMSRSRLRWLVQRAVPPLVVMAVASVAVGVAGDVLTHAAPWVEGSDPGFEDWYSRGPQVAVRATAVFGIAVAAGALIGRQLPAVLVVGGATLGLFLIAFFVLDLWMEAAAEPIPIAPTTIVSGKIYGGGLQNTATGQLVSDEEASMAGLWDEEQLDENGVPRGYTMYFLMVPSDRYGEFVLRESALFAFAAAAVLAAAAAIVTRRRPV
ncbi:MAG TPA: hypothetical protein VH859_01795 [Candidatus Limnocylindria bacterium]|jgi:hypothetical protein